VIVTVFRDICDRHGVQGHPVIVTVFRDICDRHGVQGHPVTGTVFRAAITEKHTISYTNQVLHKTRIPMVMNKQNTR
jgi:hydroxyacyl-ACP dehydratase HTD2-like protein with hotdog domain